MRGTDAVAAHRTEPAAPDTGFPAPTLAVVVPALNEARYLPALLTSLRAQTRPPDEVVVADAGSVDDTVAVATALGARVIRGGMPAVGRNAGASATTGDLLLFLDADVVPAPDFIARALAEFAARRLDIATAPVVPLEQHWDLRLGYGLTEAYLHAVERVSPHAVGACILVRRALHERLGGFDETLALAEDHDYVRRGARLGRFAVLTGVHIPTSMRRLLAQGRTRYVRALVASELRTLTGRPIHRLPPGYVLGGLPGTSRSTPTTRRARGRHLRRILARPTVEVQGDAIALAALSSVLAVGAASTRSPWARVVVPAAEAVAAASGVVALQPLLHERSFGRFFSATVATADRDLRDASGVVLARAGEDLVCEFHAVHHLRELAALRRRGRRGRLTARLEILTGIRALADAFDDPGYRDVAALVARAGVARALLRIGFVEVPAPALDPANRLEKRVLDRRIGPGTSSPPDCMVAMPRSRWDEPGTRALLDDWIARTREDLAHVTREETR